MDTVKVVLMLALAAVLWVLYHKIFRVIYFDAITALFREIVICIIIAGIIVFGGFNVIAGVFHKDKAASLEYLGTYYNDNLLDGSGNEAFITIAKSESDKQRITVSGYADILSANYYLGFESDIAIPDGNTFSCYDEAHDMTITITVDPKQKALNVLQESSDSSIPDLFSGNYVDNETWQGLLEERQQAVQETLAATEMNRWIEDYFGYYVPSPEDAREDKTILIDFDSWSGSKFYFILYKQESGFAKQHIFEIPYPLGPDATGYIEYKGADDSIAFNIQGLSNDGRQLIEITDCSYPEYVGLYVAAPEQSNEEDVHDSQNEETIGSSDNEEPFMGSESVQEPLDEVQSNVSDWDGTYVCNNGGEDGTKTLTATKNGNTLTFEISHIYGDGRSDFISGSADIGTYSNGSAFASYENEKILYFTWSGNTIEISQIGIYPDVDLEFSGLYTKSN